MTIRRKIYKVKDSNPEQFMPIGVDPEQPPGIPDEMGDALSEEQLRDKLRQNGCSEAEINLIIGEARKNEA